MTKYAFSKSIDHSVRLVMPVVQCLLLDNTQRINPEVVDPNGSSKADGSLEDSWEMRDGDGDTAFAKVRGGCLIAHRDLPKRQ